MAARDDISIVTSHAPPGMGALAPAPLGEGLGLLALTGSAAVHATFLLGLFVLQPSDAPGTAGENVIEVNVVADQNAAAFDAAALSLPPPDEPAPPVFPAELEELRDAPRATEAERPAPASQADAAPPDPAEFRLALATPEEPDGLALPAPLPPAPDAAPSAPSPTPKAAEQAPHHATTPAPATRQAAPSSTPQREAKPSATARPKAATREPQPRREASLAPERAIASDAPPPPGLDIAAFRAAVAQRVAGMKRYPPAARDRGEEGKPVVAFMLDRAGRLVSVSLAKSSGHADLDAETLAMVRRAAPFPAPPPGAGLGFSLGVNFRLD